MSDGDQDQEVVSGKWTGRGLPPPEPKAFPDRSVGLGCTFGVAGVATTALSHGHWILTLAIVLAGGVIWLMLGRPGARKDFR